MRIGKWFSLPEATLGKWDDSRRSGMLSAASGEDQFQRSTNPLHDPTYYPGLRLIALQTKLVAKSPDLRRQALDCGISLASDALLGSPGAVLSLIREGGALHATLQVDGVAKPLPVSQGTSSPETVQVQLGQERSLSLTPGPDGSLTMSSTYPGGELDVQASPRSGQADFEVRRVDAHLFESHDTESLHSSISMTTDERHGAYVAIRHKDEAGNLQEWTPWAYRSWRYSSTQDSLQEQEFIPQTWQVFRATHRVMDHLQQQCS